MSRVLPILFNSDMVRAILDGRKTATRRVIPERILGKYYDYDEYCNCVITSDIPCTRSYEKDFFMSHARYQPGDILYVRETWAFMPCIGCNGEYARPGSGMNCYDTQAVEYDDGDSISDGCFIYRADCKTPERITWRPSIHMPKAAVRIWLKVTNVRVERLQDIRVLDCEHEGIDISKNGIFKRFSVLWDSTVKEKEMYRYGWKANPWVWVIEFERCEKPEGEG